MTDFAAGAAPPGDEFTATPCATDLDLYLHPLLEDPPVRSTAAKETWTEYETLVNTARASCSTCPLLADCMYKAVVQTDVSGYVGCTTPKERAAIRKLLDVKVEADDLDSFAGTRGTRQPVDHDDVLRMRAQHPDESLEALASRLGCSLSTVKRHLRRARREAAGPHVTIADTLPTMEEVFDAFDEVVEANRARSRVC
ncbi:MAG TPA: WhiB family transcriptional regulator [Nocardioidaceae bacterium]|jgi:hypothetical protein